MMLKNKIAVITGSNRGIGLATLIKFSENGAQIIACAREKNKEFENKLLEISQKYNNKITPVYFDLNNEEELDKGLKEIEKISDKIEIIVNNAGVNQMSSFQMTSLKKIKEVFQVNLFSNFTITQKLMKILIKNKKGSIINISSNAAYECDAGRSIYSSSKSALIAFTKVLSKELGPFNIRANAVAPGLTKTDMMNDKMSKKLIDETISKIPLSRAANPEEISNVILFLASDLSSYITGETINVTGGY
jgi:3-oxoacyl-[acyl-carrier protein] reductase|tara:strand:+ start:1582 stop:2325 length:744 start_codon:yes stop_codon:yes gene_type:complete